MRRDEYRGAEPRGLGSETPVIPRPPVGDALTQADRGASRRTEPTALVLPDWAQVTEARRAHIARVVALIDTWAAALALHGPERQAWHDAALWHDALRDAAAPTLRQITADTDGDPNLLHGPATATRLAAGGEGRVEVLDAVRWHTVGSSAWAATGRALYMADFLDPGRTFACADRAFLAHQVPYDFGGTFRQVVRMRVEWTLREGKALLAPTVSLWNAVR